MFDSLGGAGMGGGAGGGGSVGNSSSMDSSGSQYQSEARSGVKSTIGGNSFGDINFGGGSSKTMLILAVAAVALLYVFRRGK